MQWFSPSKLCNTFHRFDDIHVVGDSLMRHLIHAMNICTRADLIESAHVTDADQTITRSPASTVVVATAF